MFRRNHANDYIVALRNEKGSYNSRHPSSFYSLIVALRNEKGSYNIKKHII